MNPYLRFLKSNLQGLSRSVISMAHELNSVPLMTHSHYQGSTCDRSHHIILQTCYLSCHTRLYTEPEPQLQSYSKSNNDPNLWPNSISCERDVEILKYKHEHKHTLRHILLDKWHKDFPVSMQPFFVLIPRVCQLNKTKSLSATNASSFFDSA